MLNTYYFDNLSGQEKSCYNLILSALSRSAPVCSVPCADAESARRAWEAVVLDRPDFINYSGIMWGRPQSRNGVVQFIFEYLRIDENIYREKFEGIMATLDGKIKSSDGDYEVCKKIYDFLAGNVKYETKILNEYFDLKRRNPSQAQLAEFMHKNSQAFSPYGIVVERKGVCEGIAKTFKLLCSRFGVQCACVIAREKTSGAEHMLNVVEIEGVRTFIDITNGVHLERLPMIRYDFFAVPMRIINKTYNIESDFGCNEENLSFFAKNGLRFKNLYDLQKYLAAYTYETTNGELRVFYDGNDVCDSELRDIFGEVINMHCDENHFMNDVIVLNGICNGLITDKID